jgi:hypothetical protein
MSEDYRQMWRDLGLDLNSPRRASRSRSVHGYQEIFLSQADRPAGMEYFNFVMSEVHGLRIKELVEGKKDGHKVIGSFCVFVPEEIVRAADATLVGSVHRR